MKNSTSAKMIYEGPGKTQARSGLQRNIARYSAHNPEREDCAGQPEHHQPKKPRSHANSHGQRTMGTAISDAQGGKT